MSDGSVYFTAGNQAYLRLDPTAPESPDQDSEGNCIPEEGFACTIQISATEKTNGGGPDGSDAAGTQPAEFMAASTSTSKAFFTSSEKLTDNATTGPEPALAAIARAKLGGSGVEDIEEGFLPAHASGIVNDGSHIYWADPITGNIGRADSQRRRRAQRRRARIPHGRGQAPLGGGGFHLRLLDRSRRRRSQRRRDDRPGKARPQRSPEAKFITGASQPRASPSTHERLLGERWDEAIARANIDGSSPEPIGISLVPMKSLKG